MEREGGGRRWRKRVGEGGRDNEMEGEIGIKREGQRVEDRGR